MQKPTVGQRPDGAQDRKRRAQNDAQTRQLPNRGGGQGTAQNLAPATPQAEHWAGIPAPLRERNQWVLAAADKSPLTVGGHLASVTDPNTWTDFETACQAAIEKGLDIGYVIEESDPYTCIDIDVKETTSPEDIQRFHKIVSTFDSYTERSRSGNGWHIWVEGKTGKGAKRDGVEVYSQKRYMICTGNTYIDRPIRPQYRLLEILVAEMRRGNSLEVELEDDRDGDQDWYVAKQALADTGEMGRLFTGDWQGRYPSQSEADLALTKFLARLTESNKECWSAFRMSALGRRDKASRPDYMRRTLMAARTHLAHDAVQVAHGQEIAEAFFWQMSATKSAPFHSANDPGHFRLLSENDLLRFPPQRWLVKGIIPEDGVGAIFGQSGTFKSFLVLDLMAHISNGQRWFGHRVKAAPAVYIPFEGKGGIPKRVAAWRMVRVHHGCHDATTNIGFITDPMNLRFQADRDKLVQTLTECGWAGGVLCIDTLAQAGAGINENTSEGMGEMIAIFQELQHRLGGTVLVVHHSGKVESAGLRGWSGLRGALDFAIKCWRDEDWGPLDAQFVLDKVKDGESGLGFDFSMLRVHIGLDEDGDEISSLTVIPPQEREHEQAPDEAALAAADDEFVYEWVRKLNAADQRPSGRGLEAMRPEVKAEHELTQKRLRDAIFRLKDRGRLVEEPGGPSGSKWLRAVENPQVQHG